LMQQRQKAMLMTPTVSGLCRECIQIISPAPLTARVLAAGPTVTDLHRDSLSRVIHRARRFFAPGAAAEIWATFGPRLGNPLLAESMEVR